MKDAIGAVLLGGALATAVGFVGLVIYGVSGVAGPGGIAVCWLAGISATIGYYAQRRDK